MNAKLRQKALELRLSGFSYGMIRKKLGVAKGTLSYWLKDNPLSEERILELRRLGWQKGEVSRERFRKTMRARREILDQEIHDKYLEKFRKLNQNSYLTAGLMLYLAEGSKTDNCRIIVANTDPRVLRFFIHWLADFLDIPKEKLKIWLHLYDNMDIKKEEEFWQKELKLDKKQLFKPYISKVKKSSFSYKESHRHGTCSIYFGNVVKKRELMMAVKALLDCYEHKNMVK